MLPNLWLMLYICMVIGMIIGILNLIGVRP